MGLEEPGERGIKLLDFGWWQFNGSGNAIKEPAQNLLSCFPKPFSLIKLLLGDGVFTVMFGD